MAVELVTAYISLVPTLQGVQGKVAELMGGEGEQAGRKFNAGMALGIGAAIGVIAAAAAGIGAVVRTGFDEAKEAESLNAQLSAGILSTGNAANVSVTELNELASSIQAYSGQTDDSIAATQSLLLRFTAIKNVGANRIFDDATRAAADMAARLGGDAASQAQKLGRALEDPIAGTQLLARSGVVFTDQQKEQIATLQQSGDLLGAQRLILDQVAVAYGGSAAAAGSTFAGAQERIKRAFEDISQVVVQGALPLLTPILNGIATTLQGLTPIAERVGGALSSGLGKAIDFLGPVFKDLWATLGPLAAQFIELWTTISPLSIVFKAIQPFLPQLLAAFQQLATVVGGALGSALQVLAPAFQQIAGAIVGLLSQGLKVLLPTIIGLANVLGPVLSTIIAAIAPLIAKLAPIFVKLVEAVTPLLGVLLPLLVPIAELVGALLVPLIDLLVGLLGPILDLISPLLDLLGPAIAFVSEVLVAIIKGVIDAVTWFVQLVSGSEEAGAQLDAVWSGILDFFGGLWDGIVGFFSAGIKQAIGFVTGLPGQVLKAIGNLGSILFTAGRDLIDGLIKGAQSVLRNIGRFFLDVLPGWIVDPFKAAMGIRSPARVMIPLGEATVQGIGVGVENERAELMRQMTSLVSIPSTRVGAAGYDDAFYEASSGWPSEVTLVDADGSIMARTQVRIAQKDRADALTTRMGRT